MEIILAEFFLCLYVTAILYNLFGRRIVRIIFGEHKVNENWIKRYNKRINASV
jgi:hypothetical protein